VERTRPIAGSFIVLINFIFNLLDNLTDSAFEKIIDFMLLLALAVPSLALIVGTERFISANSGVILYASDQNNWEVGQILALVLVAFPAWALLLRVVRVTRFWRNSKMVPMVQSAQY